MKKIIVVFLLITSFLLSGCALFESDMNTLNGSITGNTYECQFFSNKGQKFMTMEGQKIDISENIVTEQTWSANGG